MIAIRRRLHFLISKELSHAHMWLYQRDDGEYAYSYYESIPDRFTELSTQIDYANKVSCCYYYLGRLLCDNNEEKTSHLHAALKNYPKTETNSYELTHCYILLGGINKNKSDFNEAILNYKSATGFGSKYKNQCCIARLIYSYGTVRIILQKQNFIGSFSISLRECHEKLEHFFERFNGISNEDIFYDYDVIVDAYEHDVDVRHPTRDSTKYLDYQSATNSDYDKWTWVIRALFWPKTFSAFWH
ncbi:unnamed protein product [Didymodactylos carnosus]|uniref:Uncharacterized protein n=1 Tax=Didymodactylos carnosus TaxID=1234261 RepID=A0A814FWM3_9BILA|nr:unnamed protein product [Didymodactylos carnosus]CAF3762462.1 unnamed protein product [Didymodactylos carnosus]